MSIKYHTNEHWLKLILFLVNQINSRHNFLNRFLGTKPEEDISYARANQVNLWITLTTSLCCVLEIVLYFVYNRMVIIKK